MRHLGHFWGFCLLAGEWNESTKRMPITLCDPSDCGCWVHRTREEEAA